MGFSDVLQIIIRILSIVLLCIFIVTAYNGYLIVKEMRETVHTRLENGEFPLPTNGLESIMPSDKGKEQQGSTQEFDFSHIKDSQAKQYVQNFLNAMNNKDDAQAYRELNSLDVYLAQKKMTSAQAKLQELKAALDRENEEAAQTRFTELIELLS